MNQIQGDIQVLQSPNMQNVQGSLGIMSPNNIVRPVNNSSGEQEGLSTPNDHLYHNSQQMANLIQQLNQQPQLQQQQQQPNQYDQNFQ